MASSLSEVRSHHIDLIRFPPGITFQRVLVPFTLNDISNVSGVITRVLRRALGGGIRYSRSLFICLSVLLGVELINELTWT
jgi:hypothetical protein